MTRIDMHAHVIPPAYREGLGGVPLPPAHMEDLTATMARYAIDAAVISTGPPGAFLGDQARANELARTGNEEIAAIVRGAPDTFAGLAMLPLPDVDAALAELAHALDVLELDGVMLLSSTAGTYLGDPAWDAIYAELDRRGAYVFVHPGFPPQGPAIPEHPVWLYEFPFETTRAIAQLIYSGTLERHPSIRFQFAHLGGAAPFLAHRIASLEEREPRLTTAAPAGALEYLRRQFYDTGLTNNSPALAATREVAGIDRIVFGTDWPYVSFPEGDDPAPGLDALGPGDRAQVESQNAAALVPRLAGVVA
jgi:6-methylsalicylate decarboxylase